MSHEQADAVSGDAEAEAAHAAQVARIQDAFRRERGYFSPVWNGIIEMDPDFFETYLEFSSVPWRRGALDPKVKELIVFALAASVTHLYAPGMKVHAEQARRFGATQQELIETLELVSILGIHSVTIALPILRDVFEDDDAAPRPEAAGEGDRASH